jgi:hypothetical protein
VHHDAIHRWTRVSFHSDPLGSSASLIAMQNPVKERIVKLREEITQISEANHLYFHGGRRMAGAVGDHERRLQRLQEILDELAALTDWKKQ